MHVFNTFEFHFVGIWLVFAALPLCKKTIVQNVDRSSSRKKKPGYKINTCPTARVHFEKFSALFCFFRDFLAFRVFGGHARKLTTEYTEDTG